MVGRTLSHYEILEQLGQGGMGVVYKARDLRLDRFVCIKVLRPEQLTDESRKQRFIQEAKSASSLNHPSIITIHEIDQADGTDFIVMEFVAGKTLQHLIPGNGLPVADVLKYSIPIASGLAAANAAGIIHRDIKPGNIMVGANGIVKVLDFGLAKLTAQEEQADGATQTLKAQTEEGTVVGTAAYMSPEQAQGKPVDARSDIFSLGAVLYEMLTGRRAFQGGNRMSTLASILQQEPKAPTELDSRIPRELERIVLRCLRKDPDRRFQHMADLKVALEELKEESESGKLTPAQSGAARSRRWLPVGLAAVIVLMASAVAWLRYHSQPIKTVQRTLTRLTFNGVSFSPAISPDGRLLAYLSSAGGPQPDIWVQQIGGSNAIQVTHEKEGASAPNFSPDGTHIAYQAHGSVYEVPALGGDTQLITSDGADPFYVQNGSAVAFGRLVQNDYRLFVVDRVGGTPVAIRPDVGLGAPPAASPDGTKVLTLAARDGHRSQDQKFWWVIPISGGNPEEVVPPALLAGENRPPVPAAWTAFDGHQWVTFERSVGDTHNLFRVAVSSNGKVISDPEQLTLATGLANSPSIAGNGRMVFSSSSGNTNLWSIPIDADSARVTGERQRLTQVEGVRDDSPSLSRDGKKVAFFSDNRLVVRDLITGQETKLVQDFQIFRGSSPRISPDGSWVAYYLPAGGLAISDLYLIPTAGGAARRVCQGCGGPGGFSSKGDLLLTENLGSGLDRISLVELATGRVRDVLSDAQHQLWNPFYSWDDKWISFLMQTGADTEHYRIYITRVENSIPAGPERWIQLTDGAYHDDKQQFSPDGNTMYFTSNRDGFICLWALRLDPKTKHPAGAPFAIQHFHGSQRIYSGISESNHMEVNVAKDKIVTNLDEFHSDIWMMQLEPSK